MSSQKRLTKEFAECTESPPDGMTVQLASESDLFTWNVTLEGPAGTPYQGGKFELVVSLPRDYPFKAPVVNFRTRIWHPNITNDEKGSICLATLKSENWKPASRIRGTLESVRQLLVEPNPDDPLEVRIAEEYKTNYAEFEKNAAAYVARHAKGK